MTILKRRVRRECANTAERGRPIIVTLEPGDVIGFRLKGTRKTFRTTLYHCFMEAAKAEAERVRMERRKARKAKR